VQKFLLFSFVIFIIIPVFSQDEETKVLNDSLKNIELYNIAIKPSKSAFYSAILPGLGQAYNKDYWKIPLVYGALGSGIYFYDFNNNKYHTYRTAYKLKKLGQENDYPNISLETLERAQKYHKKYRDLSILVTTGLYVLQIVEASVDAHIQYHNTDTELSYGPTILKDPINGSIVIGTGVLFSF